jgi:hypothetical protein
MIQYPNLIPECNVDTAFVEMLGYLEPNHAPNISQVCSILEKKNANQPAIGFIDDDKKKPAYLSNFQVQDRIKNVQLLKHSTKNQYLIVVKPAMDKFIFTLCEDLGINLATYNLPRDFKAFLFLTKKESIRKDKNFKNLLNTIKQRNPPEVAKIRSWVSLNHG